MDLLSLETVLTKLVMIFNKIKCSIKPKNKYPNILNFHEQNLISLKLI